MKILPIAFSLTSLFLARAEEPAKPTSEGRPYFERIFNPRGLKYTRSSTPPPRAAVVDERWQLFPIGSLPPGKELNRVQAAELKEGDYTKENIYLTGTFVSNAKRGNTVTFTYAPAGTKRGDATPKVTGACSCDC